MAKTAPHQLHPADRIRSPVPEGSFEVPRPAVAHACAPGFGRPGGLDLADEEAQPVPVSHSINAARRGRHRQSASPGWVVRAARLTAFPVAIAAGAAALVAGPSQAAGDYLASGMIDNPAPAGSVATDSEFQLTCPDAPTQQGVDAYVFSLPTAVAVAGASVRVSGTDPAGDTNMGAFVYAADCSFSRVESPTDRLDITFALTATDRHLVVYTVDGVGTTAAVRVTQSGGSTATPTVTASPTSSASTGSSSSPSPTGSTSTGIRRSYPLEPSDPLFRQASKTNRTFFDGQWGLRTIRAPQAWQEARATGAGIKVAVVDSGLDLDHPDFACPGKVEIVAGADAAGDGNGPQDVDGHGTHVAGIIGACSNNATGVAGVAPDATILPVQVFSASGGTTTEIVKGIRAAADGGAHVLNMSLSVSGPFPTGGSALGLAPIFSDVEEAITYARSKGVVLVAAAGNDAYPFCAFPALAAGIICVGSTDRRDVKSWYSNFPVKVSDADPLGPAVVAPGGAGVVLCDASAEDILSTYDVTLDTTPSDCDGQPGYATIFGTSMASPHVAGVAALVYDRLGGARSSDNAQVVIDAILDSAVDLYGPGYDPASGFGRVDALAAVRAVPAAPDPTTTPTPSGSASASPSASVSPTASSSASPSPTTAPVRATTVRFGDGAASAAQYGDAFPLEAVLRDDAGAPMADQELTFQLTGAPMTRQVSARTDAAGVARAELIADLAPGSYSLVVGYAGQAGFRTASATRAFMVVKETTALVLVVSGNGAKRTLQATLSEADRSTQRLGGLVLRFYGDGKLLGDIVTDDKGSAVMSGVKSAKSYNVQFAGSTFYEASAASS